MTTLPKLTPFESKLYTQICAGLNIIEMAEMFDRTRQYIAIHVNNLVTKGYVQKDSRNRPIPAIQQAEPIKIKSTWTSPGPLQGTYHNVNSDVIPYNYKQLPPDDPRRIEIERTLSKVRPIKKPIETVSIASARMRGGKPGA